MNDNKTEKIYYRIIFRLASALSVGSGENRYSDNDLVRDSAGDPFIPGTSLAGIYRSLLEKKDADKYFGTAKNENQGDKSKILVYDAKLRYAGDKDCHSRSIRDCVGLDQWKTSKTGCKFDFEVIEPEAEFITYLEQNLEKGDKEVSYKLAMAWRNHQIHIGSKTMRGLGSIKDVAVCCKRFNLAEQAELNQWLDFDMYREEDWNGTELQEICKMENDPKNFISLEYRLRQKSGISIRRYTTQASTEKVQPDAQQLTCILGKNGEEIPYIPGTSWAGTFRHHMERLASGCTEEYFGNCERRSRIRFHESFIKGAFYKVLTRNAVDRFTGGVVDNALFTEKMWYGGETVLQIEIPAKTDVRFQQALAASMVDLHMGLLSVGGFTAIGRGIFEGVSLLIDQNPVSISENIEAMYMEILKKLERR